MQDLNVYALTTPCSGHYCVPLEYCNRLIFLLLVLCHPSSQKEVGSCHSSAHSAPYVPHPIPLMRGLSATSRAHVICPLTISAVLSPGVLPSLPSPPGTLPLGFSATPYSASTGTVPVAQNTLQDTDVTLPFFTCLPGVPLVRLFLTFLVWENPVCPL